MSGHSKWSTIKRAKAVNDSKKSAIFTKMAKLISIAARDKGSDPDANFGLRMAIDKARAANMPKDNIEKSIKRGCGELEGGQIEELTYEGFGLAKSQFIVKCLTDNKNRSAAAVRHAFTKFGGSLGSVMWNFDQKGVIRISKEALEKDSIDMDELELELIDAGADDILKEDEGITIYTKISDLQSTKKLLDKKNIITESADIEYIAKEEQEVDEQDKPSLEKFMEILDDDSDVADYYSNVNI